MYTCNNISIKLPSATTWLETARGEACGGFDNGQNDHRKGRHFSIFWDLRFRIPPMNWGRIKKKCVPPSRLMVSYLWEVTHLGAPVVQVLSLTLTQKYPIVPCDCGVGHYRHLRIAERPKHSVVPFLRLVENKNSKTWWYYFKNITGSF